MTGRMKALLSVASEHSRTCSLASASRMDSQSDSDAQQPLPVPPYTAAGTAMSQAALKLPSYPYPYPYAGMPSLESLYPPAHHPHSSAGFLLARSMPEAVARKGFHRVSSGDMDSSVCSTTGMHQSLMVGSKTQWAGGAMVRLHAPGDRLRAAIPRNVSCLSLPGVGQHINRLDSQALTQGDLTTLSALNRPPARKRKRKPDTHSSPSSDGKGKQKSSDLSSPGTQGQQVMQCCSCRTRTTPAWRRFGSRLMCNACGLRYSPTVSAFPAAVAVTDAADLRRALKMACSKVEPT
ncbi:hypothetical protein WJX73_001118 [Symbiochloris irregularis]|uniref:GATA-type domain-containing protein n=1 Tax=Symbiochloris irregularis TaxID=706552 RepID=A0AAW1PRF6_9CHLO